MSQLALEYDLSYAPSRFRKRTVVAVTGCWEWTGALTAGYGVYAVRTTKPKKNAYAHRFSYEWFVGEIPAGLQIDHLCRNRRCVNPAHLEPVTNRENSRRGAKGRLVTHCAHGHEYTAANTRIRANGRRACRACERERYERKKVAA